MKLSARGTLPLQDNRKSAGPEACRPRSPECRTLTLAILPVELTGIEPAGGPGRERPGLSPMEFCLRFGDQKINQVPGSSPVLMVSLSADPLRPAG
jgi:hypothetical protein